MGVAALDLRGRYESHVDRSGGPDACHSWTASKFHDGYGQIVIGSRRTGRRPHRAHRVGWELANGPLPDGVLLRHSCDNPPCQNLRHLIPGGVTENTEDRVSRQRGARGSAHGMALLSEAQVDEIRRKYHDGLSRYSRFDPRRPTQARLAAEYGVSHGHISSIVRNTKWTHTAPDK